MIRSSDVEDRGTVRATIFWSVRILPYSITFTLNVQDTTQHTFACPHERSKVCCVVGRTFSVKVIGGPRTTLSETSYLTLFFTIQRSNLRSRLRDRIAPSRLIKAKWRTQCTNWRTQCSDQRRCSLMMSINVALIEHLQNLSPLPVPYLH